MLALFTNHWRWLPN